MLLRKWHQIQDSRYYTGLKISLVLVVSLIGVFAAFAKIKDRAEDSGYKINFDFRFSIEKKSEGQIAPMPTCPPNPETWENCSETNPNPTCPPPTLPPACNPNPPPSLGSTDFQQQFLESVLKDIDSQNVFVEDQVPEKFITFLNLHNFTIVDTRTQADFFFQEIEDVDEIYDGEKLFALQTRNHEIAKGTYNLSGDLEDFIFKIGEYFLDKGHQKDVEDRIIYNSDQIQLILVPIVLIVESNDQNRLEDPDRIESIKNHDFYGYKHEEIVFTLVTGEDKITKVIFK